MSRRKSGMLSAHMIHLSNQSTNCSGEESLTSFGTVIVGRFIFSRKVEGVSWVVTDEAGVSWGWRRRRSAGDEVEIREE